MAKTTSQIVAENKAKRAEEAAIGRAREAINQKQLSTVSGSIEKTKAVLKNAIAGTTDAQKKANAERAYKSVISQYNAKPKEPQKSAVDQMWERASSTPQRTEMDDYRKRILDLQKQLTDAENAEIDWTSAADRQENARRQEELQSQIDKTRDEMNYRANMGKIDSMSEEQKQDLETLANSDNGFLSWMNIWDDQKALKALQNPEENEYAQRFGAEQRLKQSGIGGQQLQGLSETYQREMNRQDAEQAMEEARQKVQSGFGGAVSENAAAFANNLAGSVTGTLETADQAVRRAMGKSIYSTADTNRPGYRLSQKAAAAREATSEQILGEDPTLVNKAANLLYKGGTSAVDNVLRGLAGGGTAGSLALAGMGSFQDSYRSAAERGADDGTALLYGSVTAALEVATEFLPTEHLLGAKSAKECESLLRQAFVQAGLEIPGEEISLWGEIIADAYIMGDKSENNRLRAELIANGYSKEQADNEVMRRNLMESAETALTTLISSGGSVYVQGKVDSARNKLADMEARGLAANNAGQAQNLQQETAGAEQRQESPAAATTEADGLTDAQRYFRDAENGKTGNAGIEQIIQQTADELSDNMPENKPVAKTDEQARLDDAMQRTILENQRKQGEQEVYEALKAARKGQKELQKEISRAERRLAETGKGSRARIDQLKAKLEQQDGLVRQLESQSQYFTGNYERTVGEAVQAQEAVFADAKSRAAQAISDYEAGRITEAQKNAEVDAYNRAGAELKRLMGMTQEQYRADLAEAGLAADLENTQPPYEPVDKATAQWSQEQFAESAGVQPTQNQTPGNDNGNASAQVGEDAGIPMEDSTENAQNTMGDIPKTSAPVADTQNASMNDGQQTFTKQNPGIKGTGAAEANFSGKPAYNATLSENNAQADRADDVRPMELPERDINGGKVSAVTGNVYGSRITPDDFASLMEEPTAKGDFSYMPISNDRATEMAKQSIERSGNWETAYADWAKAVARGQAGAEMSARGAILLNKAAQDGNKGRWLEILSDMRELGTNTAQGLQAFRLIRTLTPPDKLEFAKVSVRKLTESFARRSGLQTEITIDESLIKEYENAQTDKQRDEVMGRIQQNVAAQIPSTFMDKFNALRYLNMLGNLKTTVRNVAGNVGASAAYRVKDTIAAGLERAAYTASGGKTELTKSVFASPEMKKAAAKDFEQYAGIISDGGKFSMNGNAEGDFARGVMDKRTIFKTKPLEAARKATNWAMNNGYFGDEAFGRAAYSRALAGYLQANGVKETDFSKIDQTFLNKAREYAVKQAQEATFHDNNTVSKTLVKLQKDTGLVGQGILPFAKTPANVLVRAEEFSPLGFINSTIKTIQKAAGNTALAEKNGGLGNFARAGQEITGADLIDSWAKSFTGAGLFVLGAWLADQGWLIGSPDEDDEKAAFDKLNGIQPFSLMLPGGENITIDFLSPIAMTMFMGANAAKIWNERGDFTYEKLEKMATSLADPMIQMSMLQGVDNTLNDIKYADNNLGQFLINAGLSYLTQGFTSTLGGQVERAFEKERMTTYVDKNSSVPAWMQKQLGKISQKIPGWDYQQTAYIDARGQTQENMVGAEGLLYNFASPGYIDKKEIDAVSAELYRLNDSATFEGSIFPESPKTSFSYTGKDGTAHKDFSMSAEQADTLKRVTGQTGTKILSDMVQSKDYAALTDNQKAQAVKLAYEYAREKGRVSALEDYPEMSGWMAGIDGKEGRAILQKVARDTLQSAVSDWAEAIKNGWDTTGDSDEMESAYKVYDSMSLDAKKKIDDSISGDAAAYLEIRSGGVATEKYISVVSGIKSLKPEKNYSNVRDIQIREEIAENRSLSAKERDIVMKAYMPDYDPKSKNPQTTELKYAEVRKLGVSAKGYSDSYRDYLDASGSGKRRRTIKLYMDTYGWDRATAQKVYDLYAGYYKPWEE